MKRIDLIHVEKKYMGKDDFHVMYKGSEGVFDIDMIRDSRWRLFMFEMRMRLFYYGINLIGIKEL